MKDVVEAMARGMARLYYADDLAPDIDAEVEENWTTYITSATAALRALDEAGYVLTKVSVVTDPRDFLSTPPEGLRTIGDKPFGRA